MACSAVSVAFTARVCVAGKKQPERHFSSDEFHICVYVCVCAAEADMQCPSTHNTTIFTLISQENANNNFDASGS